MLFRRKKKRRRNPSSGDGDDDFDLDADAMSAIAAASVYCQMSNEEDAFLEIAQDFGDLIAPNQTQKELPPPPPGFQVR